MRSNITSVGPDQLRKLAMNVEGISLAGGTGCTTAGAPSKGTDSAIVLRVVRNRASVYWNENWDGEGVVPARKRHYKADIATLADVWTVYFAPTPLGYLGALEVL